MVGWLVGWLAGWLVGWLVGWYIQLSNSERQERRAVTFCWPWYNHFLGMKSAQREGHNQLMVTNGN